MPETTLAKLRRGDYAIIDSLPRQTAFLKKLLVFGLLPGENITVLQIRPAIVVSIGNTMLALDKEIARSILVKKVTRKYGD